MDVVTLDEQQIADWYLSVSSDLPGCLLKCQDGRHWVRKSWSDEVQSFHGLQGSTHQTTDSCQTCPGHSLLRKNQNSTSWLESREE